MNVALFSPRKYTGNPEPESWPPERSSRCRAAQGCRDGELGGPEEPAGPAAVQDGNLPRGAGPVSGGLTGRLDHRMAAPPGPKPGRRKSCQFSDFVDFVEPFG